MYAIVEIGGKQVRVAANTLFCLDKVAKEVGEQVVFDRVLLVSDGADKVQVGTPALVGSKVMAWVSAHSKGDKVVVFNKKRRKGYKKKRGHRQEYTQIAVEEIVTA